MLEKDRIGSAWRNGRWDSFMLVTPTCGLRLPGLEYDGDDPDGFLTRQEMIDYLENYAERFDPPVWEGVEAAVVEADPGSERLIVRSSGGEYAAANVVVATGTFQRPKSPPPDGQLTGDVRQIHSKKSRA